MPIYKGNKEITAIYKGNTPISAIYKGDTLIFSSGTWEEYLYEFIYNSLVPTTINNKQVKNKARVNTIYANGVIENQYVKPYTTTTYNGVTVTASNDGRTITFSGTATGWFLNNNLFDITIPSGHKVLFLAKIKNTSSIANSSLGFRLRTSGSVANSITFANFNGSIIETLSGDIDRIQMYGPNTGDFTGMVIEDVQLVDLTQMFGTGNEPTSLSDNRIQKILNSDYIAYNTGKYKGTDISEISTKDSNNVDLDTIALKYQGNGATNSHDTLEITSTEYVFTKNSVILDLSTISFTYQSSNTRWYSNSIQNLVNKPTSNDNLANILSTKYTVKSFTNANSSLDGLAIATSGTIFVYTSDSVNSPSGTLVYQLATPQVIRIPRKHLGVVDLGSLDSWFLNQTYSGCVGNGQLLTICKHPENNYNLANIYCKDYETNVWFGNSATDTARNNGKIAIDRSGNIFIHDNDLYSLTADEIKTKLSGILLFYETQDEVADIPFTIEVESGGTITTDSEVLPNIEFDIKCK